MIAVDWKHSRKESLLISNIELIVEFAKSGEILPEVCKVPSR